MITDHRHQVAVFLQAIRPSQPRVHDFLYQKLQGLPEAEVRWENLWEDYIQAERNTGTVETWVRRVAPLTQAGLTRSTPARLAQPEEAMAAVEQIAGCLECGSAEHRWKTCPQRRPCTYCRANNPHQTRC
jgi:hypothetical protein